MGWGERRGPDSFEERQARIAAAGAKLAAAAAAFLDQSTTGNRDRLDVALRAYEDEVRGTSDLRDGHWHHVEVDWAGEVRYLDGRRL